MLVFILGLLPAVPLLAQKAVIHDPNAQLRQVSGYHGIEVSDAIDLYLSQGDEETVVVSAREEKWRSRIVTEVVDGILKIHLSGKSLSAANARLRAYVSFTTLDKLMASGASDVYVDGVITADKLTLNFSGASDFHGAVHLKELDMEQSGASDAHITGIVEGLAVIRCSGASDLKGYELIAENCDAHASGASDIRMTVNKALKADVSGASSVFYKGTAVVSESRSSGASTIKKSS